MRHPIFAVLCIAGATGVAGCEKLPFGKSSADETVERAFQGVNAVDGANLNDMMLQSADPDEAVRYFQRSVKQEPARLEFQRGLAKSLVRAGRVSEGAATWQEVTTHKDATDADRVQLADAQIRGGAWTEAQATLNAIPPTHETFERYRLEAMVADYNENWQKADSFYEIAVGLTTTPASVLNNWGFSKLTRGDHAAAERLFTDALRQDDTLFTAKNNLMLARAARGNYALPPIRMTQIERAELLHTLGLAAIKRGDVALGQGLLEDALESHPQHFEAAATALDALGGTAAR
ncbi:Tetratricopeptide repeat protein [Roseivivax jejudonensis]|uniref:Tetratricopeptide repeat protein n=1 Tax=Roseivivax jejudonensis TaxID=1529041 RepID=A0A1X7A819_9RHOB|nr:tetratricopeptide repeat protein [Roseivivax jejudonensis]SLN72379.1 Tetratricopeptide repeat protein [Roseivivax jejudonensis]